MSAATVYLPTNDTRALPFVETPAGRCVPVFSSLDTLAHACPEGSRYVRVPRAALATLCPDGVGILLDDRVTLTREAASLLTEPLVGESRDVPEALLGVVQAFAEARPEIRGVRWALVLPPSGVPATCVGFDVQATADERPLLEDAAAVVRDAGFDDVLFAPLREGGELALSLRPAP